jgi:hypothetical protein
MHAKKRKFEKIIFEKKKKLNAQTKVSKYTAS